MTAVRAESFREIPWSGYEFEYGGYENSRNAIHRSNSQMWIEPAAPLGNRTQQGQAMLADTPALLGVFLGDARRFLPGRVGAQMRRQRREVRLHAGERPVQIDRRRARYAQRGQGLVQRLVAGARGERERHAVGRGDSDQRRAAYLHAADGVRGVFQRGQAEDTHGVR